ncbi:MAG: leucyl aminopeptidase [Clostridiaceae bacterium]|nr:leucyl aminopeptidase [Clostridiaceae bacterium]
MKINVIQENLQNIVADGLIIGIHQGVKSLPSILEMLDEVMKGTIKEIIRSQEFKGKEGELLTIRSYGNLSANKIFLLGLGKEEEFQEDTLRRVAGEGLREALKQHCERVAVAVIGTKNISVKNQGQCISEGAMLGLYKFDRYKTENQQVTREMQEIFIWHEGQGAREAIVEGIAVGKSLAKATITARDMVNEPSNVLTPYEMEIRARRIAEEHGMEINILEKEDMEKLGMDCFLSVAKGSDIPPKLIVMKYRGDDQQEEVIGLVGKGLTFDSGGISLKPGAGMDLMKGDMGGAATVLGAMEAIGALKPKTNVIAVVGACENMPSGKAYKPGDILKSMKGKTVEILNTDAEGRLVLIDCISYAIKLGATKLVDVATLTGACLVALGTTTTALITNNDDWLEELKKASAKAGERVWQLPAFPEYKELIKSEIADLKNVGGRYAGTITAGLFLGEFVEDKPWIHMDIAGTSANEKTRGYLPRGATGVGVRALYHLVEQQ